MSLSLYTHLSILLFFVYYFHLYFIIFIIFHLYLPNDHFSGDLVRIYSKYLIIFEKLNIDPNYAPPIKKYVLAAKVKVSKFFFHYSYCYSYYYTLIYTIHIYFLVIRARQRDMCRLLRL